MILKSKDHSSPIRIRKTKEQWERRKKNKLKKEYSMKEIIYARNDK